MRREGLWLPLGAIACLLAACPPLDPPTSTVCRRLGDKCQLPEGPLGVCEIVVSSPGAAGKAACPEESQKGKSSCLRCTSQH